MSARTTGRRPETAERLLNAAERLFGRHGYDGVGMRMLAREARVNLGATTYHFGSKKKLYIETFMRYFRAGNAEQLRLLREAQASGRPLTVEKIADCMAGPLYALGLSHPNFSALLARNLVTPPPFMHAAMYREIEPKTREFTAALRRCLPGVPEESLRMRYLFSMGSLLMLSAQIGRMPPAANARLREYVLREVVRFISAGLQSEPVMAAAQLPPMPRRVRA